MSRTASSAKLFDSLSQPMFTPSMIGTGQIAALVLGGVVLIAVVGVAISAGCVFAPEPTPTPVPTSTPTPAPTSTPTPDNAEIAWQVWLEDEKLLDEIVVLLLTISEISDACPSGRGEHYDEAAWARNKVVEDKINSGQGYNMTDDFKALRDDLRKYLRGIKSVCPSPPM